MAIHLFNDAVERLPAKMAAHQPRPVPNFAFISCGNLPRAREREREGRASENAVEKNRFHIYAAHFSPSLPSPACASPLFSRFPFWHLANAKGKIAHKMRRNLQRSLCVNWVICSAPRDSFSTLPPLPTHSLSPLAHSLPYPRPFPFPLWLFVLVFYYSMFASDIFNLHPQIYFSSHPALPLPNLPLVKALKHVRVPISLVRIIPRNLHLQFHAFLQIYTFVGVAFLLGVIISFDTLLGTTVEEEGGRRRRWPLKRGVKCHWQVWAYRLDSGGCMCERKISTLIADCEKVK